MSQPKGPTIDEIDQALRVAIAPRSVPHELLHVNFGTLDCKASLVLEAWEQVNRAVTYVSSGIEDPKQRRAETLLLMLFQEALFHGYTPKPKEE